MYVSFDGIVSKLNTITSLDINNLQSWVANTWHSGEIGMMVGPCPLTHSTSTSTFVPPTVDESPPMMEGSDGHAKSLMKFQQTLLSFETTYRQSSTKERKGVIAEIIEAIREANKTKRLRLGDDETLQGVSVWALVFFYWP